jgi:hypothetical protein
MTLQLYKSYLDHYSITFNGKKHIARVYISYDHCDSDPFDVDFENELAKDKFRDELSSGVLENLWIKVSAQLCGETGTDSLGGCIVGKGYQIDHIVEEYGMIENALLDLENNLKIVYRDIKQLFES